MRIGALATKTIPKNPTKNFGNMCKSSTFLKRVGLSCGHTPTGVLHYTHGYLFPVSPDPLTALHCIRGSVVAGGMVTQGGSIFLFFFISLLVTLLSHLVMLHFWILLYISCFFARSDDYLSFFCSLSLLSSSC